jgi:hypothetical protein
MRVAAARVRVFVLSSRTMTVRLEGAPVVSRQVVRQRGRHLDHEQMAGKVEGGGLPEPDTEGAGRPTKGGDGETNPTRIRQ